MTKRIKQWNKTAVLCVLLCLALLAVPPAAAAVQTLALQSAALPRPALTGAISDTIRNDPTLNALWCDKMGVLDFAAVQENYTDACTVLEGKLRQAGNRGMLDQEALDTLLARVENSNRHWTGSCLRQRSTDGSVYELNYHELQTDENSDTASVSDDLRIKITCLDKNGAILSLTIEDPNGLGTIAADPDTTLLAFADQLDLTPTDDWGAVQNQNVNAQAPVLEHHTTGALVMLTQTEDQYVLTATLPGNRM